MSAKSDPALTATVTAILMNEDVAGRTKALLQLRVSSPMPVLDAIISLLTSPDQTLRRRAGSSLGGFREQIESRTDALAGHLAHNTDPWVRLSCAIALMSSPAPSVTVAYRGALEDKFDKVAQIACLQMAHRDGEENTTALFRMLSHPAWRVRLEACKGLITQGKADQRVVATLEAMSRETEAVVYDTESDEIARIEQEVAKEFGAGLPCPLWGKLSVILEQARALAHK